MERLVIFNPLDHGGIADYIHFQANAFSEAGLDVEVICTPCFNKTGRDYELKPILASTSTSDISVFRKLLYLKKIVDDVVVFCKYAERNKFKYILIGGFSEYGSPLWAYHFKRLRRQGCVIGCIIHDPVRDFQLGPLAWHNLSIRKAYEVIDVAYVHHDIALDTHGAENTIETVVIPFPSYPFDEPPVSDSNIRKGLNISDDDIVLLSFGHIRDGKNIDLILESLVDHPNVHLVVAGKEQSSGAKPAAYYVELAEKLSVSNRFHLMNRFIEESELADLFAGADFAILTYSAVFRSGSAALGTCVHFRKEMLVSAAEGPLVESVKKYTLGVAVAPDSAGAISAGIAQLVVEDDEPPNWHGFEQENNWALNARLVWDALKTV